MSFWSRRRPVHPEPESGPRLKRTLSWPHLMALGVGAIVGTGIYTLIGVGAGMAGPAVVLSFVIAGVVCVCAAFAYAEMASMMPAAGSAYTYTYSVMGEFLAWIVGWSLILEYSVVCGAVAVGWSGYATGFLESAGVHLPAALLSGPLVGGLVNLPAVVIVVVVAGMLSAGTRESATVNTFLVVVKIVALLVFIALGLSAFRTEHFTPFMPYGFWANQIGSATRGVLPAASIIFFAFYGFDAVATATEEARNPGRDITLGIIGSMIVCTVLYMAVAAAALGAVPFGEFASSAEPLAGILRTLGHPVAARLIGAAAVVALPTVILAFMYGQSRIFFAMARDGLLPERLGRVNAKTGSPVIMTVFTAIVVSVIAGLFPLADIAAVANAGTLCAFVGVAACLLVLRARQPQAARPFRAPLGWIIGVVAVVGCLYLFTNLQSRTQRYFFIWNAVGIVVYFAYGVRNSRLARVR
ncbi:MAG TPA: amino acid permease [Steroidobacteraceae bacterium]